MLREKLAGLGKSVPRQMAHMALQSQMFDRYSGSRVAKLPSFDGLDWIKLTEERRNVGMSLQCMFVRKNVGS